MHGMRRLFYPGYCADSIGLDWIRVHGCTVCRHHSAMDTNAYAGWEIEGKVETTLSQGNVVW